MESRSESTKVRAWLTAGQVLKVDQDAEVTEALIQQCEAEHTATEPMVRAHPLVPQCLEAQQFHVPVLDSQTEMVSQVMKRGIETDVQAEGAAGQNLVRQVLAKSKSAFGSKDATCSKDDISRPTVAGTKRSIGEPTRNEFLDVSDEAGAKRTRLEIFEQQELLKAQKAQQKIKEKAEAQEQR